MQLGTVIAGVAVARALAAETSRPMPSRPLGGRFQRRGGLQCAGVRRCAAAGTLRGESMARAAPPGSGMAAILGWASARRQRSWRGQCRDSAISCQRQRAQRDRRVGREAALERALAAAHAAGGRAAAGGRHSLALCADGEVSLRLRKVLRASASRRPRCRISATIAPASRATPRKSPTTSPQRVAHRALARRDDTPLRARLPDLLRNPAREGAQHLVRDVVRGSAGRGTRARAARERRRGGARFRPAAISRRASRAARRQRAPPTPRDAGSRPRHRRASSLEYDGREDRQRAEHQNAM